MIGELLQRLATVSVDPGHEAAITVPSGHGFLENTFDIHTGQPVAQAPRLIFQAVYGLSVQPHAPVRPPMRMSESGRANPGPLANRVYVA